MIDPYEFHALSYQTVRGGIGEKNNMVDNTRDIVSADLSYFT